MILYKNAKAIVRSRDRDTDFFDIDNGILQGKSYRSNKWKRFHI